MLQKMIEVVPAGVTLTDPIVPYDIKPYALQLTLLDGGSQLSFTGEIRVRTTTRAASSIASVQLVTKDRTGATGATISTASKGSASGFDDTFTVSNCLTRGIGKSHLVADSSNSFTASRLSYRQPLRYPPSTCSSLLPVVAQSSMTTTVSGIPYKIPLCCSHLKAA